MLGAPRPSNFQVQENRDGTIAKWRKDLQSRLQGLGESHAFLLVPLFKFTTLWISDVCCPCTRGHFSAGSQLLAATRKTSPSPAQCQVFRLNLQDVQPSSADRGGRLHQYLNLLPPGICDSRFGMDPLLQGPNSCTGFNWVLNT